MGSAPFDYAKLAGLFGSPWHRSYVKSKLRTDPLYDGVFEELKDAELPLLDLGCGLGLLAFYLRERGLEFPIMGIDYDPRKIEDAARLASENYADRGSLEFKVGDAREGIPDFEGNVTILDILQFFTPEEQDRLLSNAASCVESGGKLVIRSALRKRGWRFRVTQIGDLIAKVTFWMKAAPTHYPSEDSIRQTLENAGMEGDCRPLWGKTPFSNYLLVYRRKG
jgi:SAM-dependent methyltransferase